MPRRTAVLSARTARARLLPAVAVGLGAALLAGCSGGADPEPTAPDVEEREATEDVVDDGQADAPDDAPAGPEDVDLDALLGNKGASTGSRLLGIESCSEVEDVVAPILQPHLQVRTDEVQGGDHYPGPGPYEYRCSWSDPDDQYMFISVHGAADWDGDTREDVLGQQREGTRDIAPHVVDDERHQNLVLVAHGDNTAHRGTYVLHVASPSAPNSAITGWVSVSYGFGSETWEPKAEVPGDEVMTQVLLGLAEDATHD